MKTKFTFLAFALIAVFACKQVPKETADTIYTNGKIYTVNEAQPWAEAVAIREGKIFKVGTKEEIEALKGENTIVVDLEGKFVMPGFVDTHTHAVLASAEHLNWHQFDPEPTSLEEIQKSIKAYADANPDLEWIQAGNFPKGLFDRESPHRTWLDEVVSDRPVTILDQGGHAKWCNTRALEVAGMMDPNFEVPEFGIVERDADGLPSGTIRETSLGHMGRFIPPYTSEQYLEAIYFSQNLFNENGITAHRSADGEIEHLKVLKEVSDDDGLSLHWAVSLDVNYFNSAYTFAKRMEQVDNRKQYSSEFLGVDFVKIFVDGDVNGYGIKMLEPFEGTTDEYGKMNMEANKVIDLTKKFDKEGISVQFHAIGDASIEVVTQALEAAAEQNGGKLNTRHYPDHLGFITPDQIERITSLNRMIGFAPYFAMTLPGIHESYLQFVGEERLNRIQPARTALDAGAIIGVGSDYPALPPSPFPFLEGMTNRKNPWDATSEANNAAESITLEEAIYSYTLGGAHALLKEDKIGSIEEGKYADFVVLNNNLFEIPVNDISETQILTTVFSGKVVFNRSEEEGKLDIVEVQITNKALDNAIDAADLNLLVEAELDGHNCIGHDLKVNPGSSSAPAEINQSFSLLADDYEYIRPARTIFWKADNTTYWIQWTEKDETKVLWAYDPELKKVVEVLQLRDKDHQH